MIGLKTRTIKKATETVTSLVRKNIVVAVVVVGVVVVGIITVAASRAATPVAVVEPEAGTVTSLAEVVNDTTASNSKAVKFKAAPPTTPTDPPPPSGSCTGSQHTPGGSDALGGCWPNETNTGVPAGATLGTYSSPCTLKAANLGATTYTITGKDATSCGILAIYDVAVTIKNSKMPVIDITNASGNGSVTISDSDVTTSGWSGGMLWGSNITATRVDVTGGQHSVHCESKCTITDSYLHGQEAPAGKDTHNNAFITNGGSTMTVRHNTLFCSAPPNSAGGGCTADLSLFGDFGTVSNITVDKNLFVATPSGGYCGSFGYNPGKPYGSNPSNITVTNNIFQRGTIKSQQGTYVCGLYGAVTSFIAGSGNLWSGNKFASGETINSP